MIKNKKIMLLLTILLIFIISFTINNNINLLLRLDNNFIYKKNDEPEEKQKINSSEDNIDISKIAYGITDGVDNMAISKVAVEIERYEVFDGLTIEELTNKLNKSLKGVIANKGNLIATKSLELGINPYIAVAIMLHETGCSYTCSKLAKINYNFGGMKGRSGKYQKFSSIDEGIIAFLNNLYNNYYKYGLNTPEKMNSKYAASTSWAEKVNNYMQKIKNA